MQKPIVHLNGSSARSLAEGYSEAALAISDAAEKLAAANPHPRDYYVDRDPDAFTKARDEHIARQEKLEAIRKELEELALHCIEFEK